MSILSELMSKPIAILVAIAIVIVLGGFVFAVYYFFAKKGKREFQNEIKQANQEQSAEVVAEPVEESDKENKE